MDLGTLFGRISLDDGPFKRALDRTQQGMKSLSKSAKAATMEVGKVGEQLSTEFTIAGAGMIAAAGFSIKAAGDFETSMNVLEANLGPVAGGMEELSALAKQMGADTVFSAKDAADAMVELAKGGMTDAQIKGGALAATMSIAAVEGMELGQAATVASNTMNMFGLAAEDAAEIADALAGASAASSASVESLSLAMAQVGPGAVNAGLSLQETVGALAAFDQAGIKGSDAGTSLKTMLASLVPKTSEAAAEMKKLGLNFVDASGNMLPLADISEQLKQKLSGLSESQRIATMNTIFGSDASRAALVLMKEGAAGVEKYTQAATEKGKAEELAAARTKGFNGALEQFTGSAETLAITMGTELLPAATAVTGALVTVTNVLGVLPGPVLGVTGGLLLLGGTFLILAPRINRTVEALGIMRAALVKHGVTMTAVAAKSRAASAMMFGPWGAALAVAIGFLALYTNRQNDSAEATGEFTKELAFQNGTLDQNSRKLLAQKLVSEGLTDSAKELNLTEAEFLDLIIEGGPRLEEMRQNVLGLRDAQREGGLSSDFMAGSLANTNRETNTYSSSAVAAIEAAKRYSDALGGQRVEQDKVAAATGNASDASSNMAGATGDLEDAASKATEALKKYKDMLQNLDGGVIDVEKANDAMATAINRARGEMDKGSGSLSGNKQAAIDNRAAMQNLVDATLDAAGAQVEFGDGQRGANQKLKEGKDALEAMRKKFGLSKTDVDRYKAALDKIPPKVPTVIDLQMSDADRKLLAQVQPLVGSRVVADLRVRSGRGQNVPGSAMGGPVYGTTLVGERGPEVVTFSRPAYVTPNNKLSLGGGGAQMPSTLVVVDADGALIGRMRVEASGVVGGAFNEAADDAVYASGRR